VAALPDQPDDDWLRGHGLLAAVLELLCQGPLPTVAALPGAAWGAGCELALSCDLRVAHAGVTLAMPPVRLGIIYTPQGVARLLALCGAGRARRLLLTAEPIDAASAEQWGLIDRLVDESQVLPVAIELATQLGEKPPAALLGTRQLIEQLLRHGPQLSPAAEQELLQRRHQAWQSPEAQAARQRFRKPRPPG
jgi:enoyl-CoA hydratase/carnithine racemase